MKKETTLFSLMAMAIKRGLICLTIGITLFAAGRPVSATPTAFGINMPWIHYGTDFGADAKYPGSSATYNGSQMQGYLDDMRSKHMNIVRMWLFEDQSGLTFSGNYCTGVSSQTLNYITDFVNRANADHLTVYCMLFNNDIPTGYITSDGGVSLVNNVVLPLARALNGKAVQYDIMNECDYAAPGLGWTTLRNFLGKVTTAIHSVSSSDWVTASDDHADDFNLNFYNTLGSLGFNFYDYHQYSDVNTALRVTPAAVHNAPLFLGEFGPTGSGWDSQSASVNSSLVDYFTSEAKNKGYTGMLAWSYTDGSNYQIKNNGTIWNLEYYGNLWGINP